MSEPRIEPGDASASEYSAALSRELALTCDESGMILWADQRAMQLLGAVVGASLYDFTIADSREKCALFLGYAAQQRVTGWELTLRSRGEPVVFECTGIPWLGQIMVVAIQLPATYQAVIEQLSATVSELSVLQRETERQSRDLRFREAQLHEMNRAVERERGLLQAVLRQMPSGVLVLDGDGRQLLANEQLAEILSDDPAAQGVTSRIRRTIEAGATIEAEELERTHADGMTQTLRLSASPVSDADGTVVATVAVFHDITALKALQERLEHDSLHDPLTGLPNRRMFGLRLEHALSTAHRRGADVAVLFLDLDGFKQINDTLGHAAGDAVLVETARRLRANVRGADTPARLAGDEFAVVLEGVVSERSVIAAAERMLAAFQPALTIEGQELVLSPSIGVAISPGGTLPADPLLHAADSAMYAAKRAGKGRYHLHADEDE